MPEAVAVSEHEMQEASRGRIRFPIRQVLLVCVGYYVGALIAQTLRFPSSHLSLLWPPTAIVMAALLLTPPRKWWLYLLAVAPVHVLIQLQDNVPGWGILSQLVGNFGQAMLAAAAVRYVEPGVVRFDTFRGALVFSLCAALFAPVFVSSIAAYLYVLSGWEQDYWYVWRARVLSNVLSTLTIVPPILVVASAIAHARKLNPWRFIEAGLIAVGLVLIGVIASRLNVEVTILLYAPLPLLLWAAVRFGVGGLCLSILVAACMVFLDASGGRGPFTTKSPAENVLSLQMFLITISLPLIFLAALTEERRDREEALSESEERFRTMANTAPVMIWMSGTDKLCTFFNKGWLDFTGRTLEQELGNGWAEGVHREDFDRCLEIYVNSFNARQEFTMEYRLRRFDGEYRAILDYGVPRFALDGAFLGYIGSCIDMGERKRAEEALKKERAFLRQVIDIDPNFIFAKDREGRFTLVNQAVADAYGTTVENLIGKTDADFNPNREEVESFRRMDLEVIDTLQERFIPEEHITDARGQVRWVQTVKRPIIEKDGSANQVLGAATDITQRKKAESELQRNRQELAHVSRISTMGELAASLAHELNQPLTAILSNAQAAQRFLAAKPAAQDEIREILQDIVEDNSRASEVIRRMRTLAKKGELDIVPLEFEGIIRDVVLLLHSDAVLLNITVVLELGPGLPPARGDKVQLQQVILNLMLNAFDAMRDRSANERRVVVQAQVDGPGLMRVAVRDRGTGLSADKLDKIFQPFYTTKRDGLGMGLSICRTIIEAHGGRLWAENNPDRGATFYFTVPVAKHDQA